MSRLIAQPIYRDAVINGKFLAGVVTIAVMLTSMVMLVGGMGLSMIGVPPTAEEVLRLMAFLGISILYGAFWLGLAMLFSIFFVRTATSALASIAVWMFFIFLFIFPFFAQLGQEQLGLTIMRISPITVFWQVTTILLVPGSRTMEQLLAAGSTQVPSNALSLGQSLLMVAPHMVTIILLTVICFAFSYTRFMREEIRA